MAELVWMTFDPRQFEESPVLILPGTGTIVGGAFSGLERMSTWQFLNRLNHIIGQGDINLDARFCGVEFYFPAFVVLHEFIPRDCTGIADA